MPKETFWDSATAVEGDNSAPILTVAWHKDCPCEQTFVALNGVKFDSSGITRLIGVLPQSQQASLWAGFGNPCTTLTWHTTMQDRKDKK